MRHGKRKTIYRAADQRKALLRTLARELILHGQIKTTLKKAKVLRSFVEKVLTKAIKANACSNDADALHLKRQIVQNIYPDVLNNTLSRAQALAERPGGYTRILKLPSRRGDNAQLAIIQILDQD